jgi:hypothetical protein
MIYGLANEIVNSKRKGGFASVTWNKQLKTLNGVSGTVEKVSTTVVRLGVRYENTKAVKEKYGTDYKAQPLPWGQWFDKEHRYFIEHKGNMYLRCTAIHSPFVKVKTKYFLNGKEISKAEAEKLCLKSKFASGTEMSVFTIKLDNIISIK